MIRIAEVKRSGHILGIEYKLLHDVFARRRGDIVFVCRTLFYTWYGTS